MNLNNWVSQAKDHWKQHQPTLFKQLQANGQLGPALRQAAERTHEEMSQLEEAGLSNQEAWEMTREKYLFPAEESGMQDDEPMQSGRAMQDVMQILNQQQDEDEPLN